MEKFLKELNETKQPWIIRIGEYLLSREDIHENLKKENKSLTECFNYVLIQISKQAQKVPGHGFSAACGDDGELYSLAVHYYDEDDIKVGKKNFKCNADGSADMSKIIKTTQNNEHDGNVQQLIDKAVNEALDKYKNEEKAKEKQKKEEQKAKKEQEKTSKKKNDENQLSLFDL